MNEGEIKCYSFILFYFLQKDVKAFEVKRHSALTFRNIRNNILGHSLHPVA